MDKKARDRRYNARRPAHHGWYKTAEWRAKAKAQLKREPFCRMCGDKTRATIADHVKPHKGNAGLFWRGELQSLCSHHHSAVKQSIERSSVAGCDASGMPLDPDHEWI